MLARAHTVFEKAGVMLYELQKSTGKKIAITGHSLGAGTAILVMIKLFKEEAGKIHGFRAEKCVKCWAFAPPPVFGPLHKVPRWVKACTTSFVHEVDMVPRACLHTAIKFMLAWKKVDEAGISAKESVSFLCGGDRTLDHHLPDFEEMSSELAKDYPAFQWLARFSCCRIRMATPRAE